MLSLGSGIAQAGQTLNVCSAINDTSSNFTMLQPNGAIQGGTNDVAFTWNGSLFNANSDYTGPGSVSNASIASTTAFSANVWTAHDVQVFGPGTYTFNVRAGANPADAEGVGTLTMTVGANQFGMHMLFDWNAAKNIDVVVVLNKNATFGSGLSSSGRPITCNTFTPGGNCLWNSGPASSMPGGTFANRPLGNKTWLLASVDQAGGDGTPGTSMPTGGPFAGFNANFNFNGTLSPSDGVCGPAIDTSPDPISFTGVINAAYNTTFTADAMFTPPSGSASTAVSGIGVDESPSNPSRTAPISISGGGSPQYSINGGEFTNAAGTVSNGNTVRVRATSGAVDNSTVTATLNIGGATGAFVVRTPVVVAASGSNFTMIDPGGGVTGGTNDVAVSWDNSCTSNVASADFTHMKLSSATPFSSYVWTAHHIRAFCGPGTYIIDTTCTVAQLNAGTVECNNPLGVGQTKKHYTFTVGAGQIGAHILFDWNNATNIDVIEVWNQNQVFGPSPMHTGAGACNNPTTVWNLMSTDWDVDGKNGGAMIDGPFGGFSANFNLRTSGTPLTCSAYTPSVNVGEPTGTAGGGCSISPAPGKALARGDWWLVAGFLAWLGAFRMRFKRQAQS